MGPMDREEQYCILCRTPISPRAGAGTHDRFCCAGCEKVYDVLAHLPEGAKDAYVKTASRLGLIPSGEESAPVEPERRDEAAFLPDSESLRTERFQMEGLVCPSCSWVSSEVLSACEGVRRASVNYFTGTAEVTYDMTETGADALDDVLRPLGYGLAPIAANDRVSGSRRATYRFVVTAILTMNIMSLSVLRYFHTLGRLDQLPAFLPWLEGLLVLPVLYIGWLPTARRALVAFLHRRPTMDLLIALGVFAAALLSFTSLLLGRDDMYFETCAGLVTISLLSRMIETRLRDTAFSELTRMMKMPVVRVRRILKDGTEAYVSLSDIAHGDRVRLCAGETAPVDGTIAGKGGSVTEAQLTGEPTPKEKRDGDMVTAGSTVLADSLDIIVVRRFEETLLSRIAARIGEVLSKRETHLRQADRIAGWFVPGVVAAALVAWLVRLLIYGIDFALSPEGWFPSVAVLAVACPCAFSLAGISAVTAAVGSLLKKGFLVNEVGALEALPKIDHIIFDKTGTLTEGAMTVDRLVFRENDDEDLLRAVLSVEARATHPAAEAIREFLSSRGFIPSVDPSDVEDLPGKGRIASVESRRITVGSAQLFDRPFHPEGLGATHTAVWVGWNDRAEACFLLHDHIKEHAAEVVSSVRALAMTTELLSGDREEVAAFVGSALGIESTKGNATIEYKIAWVENRIREGRHVAYVGDGTNDAEAMSVAHLSLAPARSTDEALAAAGLIAVRGDITNLAEVFSVGRKLKSVTTQNYFWAFAFNTFFIPAAALGKLVPLAAMLLMFFSSGAVLLNSTRLRK